jgi:mersacidin/lichenicidin family type 2 lantibiotic
MNITTIIQAWKDPDFRPGLTAEERSLLPENPAGLLELDEADLAQVAGGRRKRRRSRSHSHSRSRSRSRSRS